MPSDSHSIGRLEVQVDVPDLDLAMALRPRIETLAWRLMPKTIERLFDALAPEGADLHIERLDLDLGAVRSNHLEDDALGALERALDEALRKALAAARYSPSPEARLIPAADLAVEGFEAYLASGLAPVSSATVPFDPQAQLARIAEAQPKALAESLRRLAYNRRALERLVLQVGEAGFLAVLRVLAPAEASPIVAIVEDIVVVHRARPLATTPGFAEARLRQLISVATLEFLLRDAGSQFNRRMFLASLLRREATVAGIDYADLLTLASEALDHLATRSLIRTTFPTLLAELLAESRPSAALVAADPARNGEDAALASAGAGDLSPLLAFLRRRAGDQAAMTRLARRMDRRLFADVLRAVDSAQAAIVLAGLDQLHALHRAVPLLPLSSERFADLIRSVSLGIVLRASEGRTGRSTWLKSVLREAARSERVPYEDLLGAFAQAMERLAAPPPPGSALTALMAEITAAKGSTGPTGDAKWVAKAGEERFPPTGDKDNPILFGRAIAALSEQERARYLVSLDPINAPGILADLRALVRLHAAAPLAGLPRSDFQRLAWVELLSGMAAARGGAFDRRGLWRRVLDAIARHDGGTPDSLAAKAPRFVSALARVVESAAARSLGAVLDDWAGDWANPAADVRLLDAHRRSAELFLATGRPMAAGRILIQILERDPAWLAALVLRLARAEPAAIGDLVDRLLDWLTPHELLACLAPGAIAVAQPLLDGFDGGAGAIWHSVFVRLLEGVDAGDGAEGRIRPARVRKALAASLPSGPSPLEVADISNFRRDADGDVARSRALVERFLRTGAPRDAGKALTRMIARNGPWLGGLIRDLARDAPGELSSLIDRLLAWLTPAQLLGLLAPRDAGAARAAVSAVGGDAPAAWKALFVRLLDVAGQATAGAPGGARLDRLALVRHVLETGAPPWWASGKGATDAIFARVAELTVAELIALFLAGDPDATAERLWRAIDRVGPETGRRLLARIAPWAAQPRGPLASILNAAEPAHRLDILVRAAAATLGGAGIDLAGIVRRASRPSPGSPPQPVQATGPRSDGGLREERVARLLAWLDGAVAPATEAAMLIRLFAELADRKDPRLTAYLAEKAARPAFRRRWTRTLPDEALGRIVFVLVPADARAAIDALMLLGGAWRQIAPFGAPRPEAGQLWEIVLALAAERRGASIDAVVEGLATALTRGDSDQRAKLKDRAGRLAQEGGYTNLTAVLRRGPGAPSPRPPRNRAADDGEPVATEDPKRATFIANAGLVLVNPYLPMLFERLGLLPPRTGEPRRIKGFDAVSRAVHLLQYMVDERLGAPEPALALNKLLCGVSIALPVSPSIEPVRSDLDLCDDLLHAMIANWPVIRNTSLAALRETFLQREGRLLRGEGRWSLRVQRKGLDVLTDRVPWSFATVYHDWMADPIHVTW